MKKYNLKIWNKIIDNFSWSIYTIYKITWEKSQIYHCNDNLILQDEINWFDKKNWFFTKKLRQD